jgi:hypothetical protein
MDAPETAVAQASNLTESMNSSQALEVYGRSSATHCMPRNQLVGKTMIPVQHNCCKAYPVTVVALEAAIRTSRVGMPSRTVRCERLSNNDMAEATRPKASPTLTTMEMGSLPAWGVDKEVSMS